MVHGSAHAGDRPRVVGDGIVEVEPHDVAQVVHVLLPERLIQPELDVVLLDHLLETGLDVAAQHRLLEQVRAHRILATQPR
jgi:hypothetical protein